MALTYVELASTTVGSGGASSIVLGSSNSIPQTYTNLLIVYSLRSNRSGNDGDDIQVHINGESKGSASSFYSWLRLRSAGASAAGDGGNTVSNPAAGYSGSSGNTSLAFSSGQMYLGYYTSSTAKVGGTWAGSGSMSNAGSTPIVVMENYYINTTSAITQITLAPYNGTSFAQYSTAYLYGIKSA